MPGEREIIEALPDVVFCTDAEGRWTFLGGAFTELTGRAADERLGKSFVDDLHPDDREGALDAFRDVLARPGEPCLRTVRALGPAGAPRRLEVHARAVAAPAGAAAGVVGVARALDGRAVAALGPAGAQAIGDALTAVLGNVTWAIEELADPPAPPPAPALAARLGAVAAALGDARLGAERVQRLARDLAAPPAPRGERGAPVPGAPRRVVLVVDDEPLVASALARLLRRRGYEVQTVGSGADALDRLAAGERFDAVLCDVSMPGIDGLALHAQAGALDPAQAARFVFMTAGLFGAAARARLAALPNPNLDKPLEPGALEEALRLVGAARDPAGGGGA